MTPSTSSPGGRLVELDWLRIGAFGLLILYHVGMFYVSWDWHVKSPRLIPALEVPMRLMSPWRMSLLFVVSGAATALLAAGGRPLAGPRTRRLLWPLLFGMAVVVPPQAYLEVVEKVGYAGSYLDFLALYYTGYGGFCRGDDCLDLPTWNHLWFVAYLWVYTLVWAAGRWVLGQHGGAGESRTWAWPAWLAHGGRLIWAPWLLFAAARVALLQRFPTTHDLLHDHYMHVLYGSMFALGALLFGHRDDRHGAWAAAVRLRWWALGLAVAAAGVSEAAAVWWADVDVPPAGWLAALRASNAMRQWAPIVALLGFARLHLAGRDHQWRAWLGGGIFAFYIVHQTVTVVAGHALAARGWPLWVELPALVGATLAGCVLAYEAARRVRWLRPVMGVSSPGLNSRAAGAPAPGSCSHPPCASVARGTRPPSAD
ncbi:MAG: acetyltransferase [Burkholderiales bacterium]|nr:acetyltransferase [Burkholderiales bacterium]